MHGADPDAVEHRPRRAGSLAQNGHRSLDTTPQERRHDGRSEGFSISVAPAAPCAAALTHAAPCPGRLACGCSPRPAWNRIRSRSPVRVCECSAADAVRDAAGAVVETVKYEVANAAACPGSPVMEVVESKAANAAAGSRKSVVEIVKSEIADVVAGSADAVAEVVESEVANSLAGSEYAVVGAEIRKAADPILDGNPRLRCGDFPG